MSSLPSSLSLSLLAGLCLASLHPFSGLNFFLRFLWVLLRLLAYLGDLKSSGSVAGKLNEMRLAPSMNIQLPESPKSKYFFRGAKLSEPSGPADTLGGSWEWAFVALPSPAHFLGAISGPFSHPPRLVLLFALSALSLLSSLCHISFSLGSPQALSIPRRPEVERVSSWKIK